MNYLLIFLILVAPHRKKTIFDLIYLLPDFLSFVWVLRLQNIILLSFSTNRCFICLYVYNIFGCCWFYINILLSDWLTSICRIGKDIRNINFLFNLHWIANNSGFSWNLQQLPHETCIWHNLRYKIITCFLFRCSKFSTVLVSSPNFIIKYAAVMVALLLIPAIQWINTLVFRLALSMN